MKRPELPRDWITGCYSIDLYCLHPNHEADYGKRMHAIGGPGDVPDCPVSIIGETRGECVATARREGWWIGREDDERKQAVLCPYHAKEVPK